MFVDNVIVLDNNTCEPLFLRCKCGARIKSSSSRCSVCGSSISPNSCVSTEMFSRTHKIYKKSDKILMNIYSIVYRYNSKKNSVYQIAYRTAYVFKPDSILCIMEDIINNKKVLRQRVLDVSYILPTAASEIDHEYLQDIYSFYNLPVCTSNMTDVSNILYKRKYSVLDECGIDIDVWNSMTPRMKARLRKVRTYEDLVKILTGHNTKAMKRLISTINFRRIHPEIIYIVSRVVKDRDHILHILMTAIEECKAGVNHSDLTIYTQLVRGDIKKLREMYLSLYKRYKLKAARWLIDALQTYPHHTIQLLRDMIYEYSLLTLHQYAPLITQRILSFNLLDLHDLLASEYSNMETTTVSFSYTEKETMFESTYPTLAFVLPHDSKELEEWGRLLHNCVKAYTQHIILKKSLILGVKANEKLLYCAELHVSPRPILIQLKACANQDVPNIPSHTADILSWLHDHQIYVPNYVKLNL